MSTVEQYTPDADRLAASLPGIYAGHPDWEGLAAARRIASTAADLMAAGRDGPDAVAVNTAALFHLSGSPDDHQRPTTSATIAEAWLRGAGAPESFIAAVRAAILGAWDGNSGGDDGRWLWHAGQLDLVSVERHDDYLKDAPADGRARESYLAAYRRACLLPALHLRERLSMPAAVRMYDERLPRLAAWLDGQDRGWFRRIGDGCRR